MPARLALPDQIYGVLKHRILTCAIDPGEKLNENDLAQELTVSRTPLREALNRLALEGLVVLAPYKGYLVRSITVPDILALSELRRIVESEVAALAAVRTGPNDYENLKKLARLSYTPGHRDTYEDYLQANTAFHVAMARCTGNPRLEKLVESVLDQLQRPLYLGLDKGINAKAATEEHLQLLEAIRARNADRARIVMSEQIQRSEQRILSAIKKIGIGVNQSTVDLATRYNKDSTQYK